MTDPLAELGDLAARDTPSDVLLATIERLLTDQDALRGTLSDPVAMIERAGFEFRQMQLRLLHLASRFAEIEHSSLHRTSLDPRAVVATGTSAYLNQTGIYMPNELQAMREDGRIDTAWHARESLRLVVLLIALRSLIRRLEKETIDADGYARAVREQAELVAAIELPVVLTDH